MMQSRMMTFAVEQKGEPMSDLIYRQAAIDALANAMPSLTTPDGCGEFDHEIQIADEAFVDAMQIIHDTPSADVQPAQQWIPVSEQLPEDEQEVLFSTKTGRVHLGRYHNDNSVNQWYSSLDKMRAWNNIVNAWMPLPEPYKDGEQGG